jgi:murein DD-endopeptidase MepM/ murein hydrolase activator NlpD
MVSGLKYYFIFTFLFPVLLTSQREQINLYYSPSKSNYQNYQNFVFKNAPTEDAYLSLLRLIDKSISTFNYDEAIQILNENKTYFKNDNNQTKKIEKVIEILKEEANGYKSPISNIINSTDNEYCPIYISEKETKLFFTYKRKDDVNTSRRFQSDEDIYVSNFDKSKWQWETPEPISGKINTRNPEAILSINEAYDKMIIRGNYKNQLGRGDMYIVSIQDEKQKTPLHINSPVNTDAYDSFGILIENDRYIIFSSDRNNSHLKGDLYHGQYWGNQDLYVSEQVGDNLWTEPINLGQMINTPYSEVSPFLSKDGKTLYFSSDGHPGLGRLDVFKTTRQSPDSWTEWSEPINLGKVVNSAGHDLHYKFSSDNSIAYMATQLFTGRKIDYDIYSINYSRNKIPETYNIEGTVTDKEGNPLDGLKVSIRDKDNKEIAEKETDDEGKYAQPVQKDDFPVQTVISDENHHPTETRKTELPDDGKDQNKPQLLHPLSTKENNHQNNQTKPIQIIIEDYPTVTELNKPLYEKVKKAIQPDLIQDTTLTKNFIWPLSYKNEFEKHIISMFYDHDSNYPTAVKDYFCNNRSYDLLDGYNHSGTDIMIWPFSWYLMEEEFVNVIAVADGHIIIKDDGNYDKNYSLNTEFESNTICIQHIDGSVTCYAHLKKYSLTEKNIGDFVSQGVVIGKVGSSGMSTGPHLHFEYISNNFSITDPFNGNCNNGIVSSMWENQKNYFDPNIVGLYTHSNIPEIFSKTNAVEKHNIEIQFYQGDTVFLGAYYRDLFSNNNSHLKITNSNGSLFEEWDFSLPDKYMPLYAYVNYIILPPDAPVGEWSFSDEFIEEVKTTYFFVNSTEDYYSDTNIPVIMDSLVTLPSDESFCVEKYFTFDVSEYIPDNHSYSKLNEISTYLKSNSFKINDLVIIGHTDTDSTENYNYSLSIKRAGYIKKELKMLGVAQNIKIIGKGEAEPIIIGGIEDKQASRRVELCY